MGDLAGTVGVIPYFAQIKPICCVKEEL